jgi:hypothetical protein
VRLFISWSKAKSRQLAVVICDWLPEVIQQVQPWMSDEDVDKGQRWRAKVGAQLNQLDQGILCVTTGNLKEPWLNFEAGALAKSLESSRFCLQGPVDAFGSAGQLDEPVALDRSGAGGYMCRAYRVARLGPGRGIGWPDVRAPGRAASTLAGTTGRWTAPVRRC